LLSKSVRVFFDENHNIKYGLNSIDKNIARLWTWKGKYFGYKAGQQLWAYDGRHVGIFVNEEVYGQDGLYLGEIYKGRLVRNKNKLTQKNEPFIPDNITIKIRKFNDISSMMVMFEDFEDFPEV